MRGQWDQVAGVEIVARPSAGDGRRSSMTQHTPRTVRRVSVSEVLADVSECGLIAGVDSRRGVMHSGLGSRVRGSGLLLQSWVWVYSRGGGGGVVSSESYTRARDS